MTMKLSLLTVVPALQACWPSMLRRFHRPERSALALVRTDPMSEFRWSLPELGATNRPFVALRTEAEPPARRPEAGQVHSAIDLLDLGIQNLSEAS
jgi:hypothetical protein